MAFKMKSPLKQWASMIRIAPKSSINVGKGRGTTLSGATTKEKCKAKGKGWDWVKVDGKYGCHMIS